ncbi:transposase [Ligilactobacillus sp. WILCCON 0076]|uniref:Transposase n=1 Tax=Ligilactobacillus ubinensis TaxID=2876789 RepID=A0A9X2JLH7_9LACO|nr:transposase [Ligilactobacillus ubinensis]MCP0886620.1 transposase [Ligilactobacillus ubinensis]
MKRKKYTVDFKKTIVDLYNNGTSINELKNEYGLSNAIIYNWAKLYTKDDATGQTQADVLALQKRLAQLESENDILKKALTIFAKK